jgi:hypothetical protein
VAQNTFDVLGGVLYILCLVLEGGIFLSHLIWLFRTRKIRRAAKAQGCTFDQVSEERVSHGVEFKFAERHVKFWGRRKEKADLSTEEAGERQFDDATVASKENAETRI